MPPKPDINKPSIVRLLDSHSTRIPQFDNTGELPSLFGVAPTFEDIDTSEEKIQAKSPTAVDPLHAIAE